MVKQNSEKQTNQSSIDTNWYTDAAWCEATIERLMGEESRLELIVSSQVEELEVFKDRYEEIAKSAYRIEGERNALAEVIDKLHERLDTTESTKLDGTTHKEEERCKETADMFPSEKGK